MATRRNLRGSEETQSSHSLISILITLPLIYLKSENASDEVFYGRLVKVPSLLPFERSDTCSRDLFQRVSDASHALTFHHHYRDPESRY